MSTVDGFNYKDLNGTGWRENIYYGFFNYEISNYDDLGKEYSMFGVSEYDYPFVIIGQNSKIAFSHLSSYGPLSEDLMRTEIRKALDGFGNLQQLSKLSNIYLNNSKNVLDLDDNFTTVNLEPISYEIVSISDNTIVTPSLSSSQLTLTKGVNTGISNIKVKVTTSSETIIDSFDVMIYPTSANVIDFETGNIYDHWFHEGDSDWYIDTETAFNGVKSARSGSIENGDSLNATAHSLLRTTFITTVDDTLAFAYKISSQYDSDGFEVLIDESWVNLVNKKWSGEVDWSFVEYPLKAGKHSIEWNYFKLGINSSGMDATWLDIIKIPGIISGIEEIILPSSSKLIGNYPNPFNGITSISYKLANTSEVKLSVFNMKGELVSELVNEKQNRGEYQVPFNAFNVNSGVYFYRLEMGLETQTGKMIYLK